MNELEVLALISALTAMMWMPYVIERIYQQGLMATVGYPDTPASVAPWADRAKKAHQNALENLVIFAALVLALQFSKGTSELTLLAAQIYVVSRVVHYVCYLLAIPWLRTLAFFGGFLAQLILAVTLFNQ